MTTSPPLHATATRCAAHPLPPCPCPWPWPWPWPWRKRGAVTATDMGCSGICPLLAVAPVCTE